MEEKPKFSLVEIILMLMITGSADLFELFATLLIAVPVIGQILLVIKWFVAMLTWPIIQFWLIMKGSKGLWFLSGSLLDIVANFVGFDIPFGKTISLMTTVYLANHPKIARVAQVAGSVAGKPGLPTPEKE